MEHRERPLLSCTPELEPHRLLEGACDMVHVPLGRHQLHGGGELVSSCDLWGGGGLQGVRRERKGDIQILSLTHTHTHASPCQVTTSEGLYTALEILPESTQFGQQDGWSEGTVLG